MEHGARKKCMEKQPFEEFDLPLVKIRVACSKGTYIRALARDLGEKLNCGAYLTGLRRTRIGNFKVENALDMDSFLKKLTVTETN